MDIDKMLVASYPDMDWDSDGKVGYFDKDRNLHWTERGV